MVSCRPDSGLIDIKRSTRLCCPRSRYGSQLLHFCHPILKYYQADCVFPTRTARFGVALTHNGPLNLSMLPCFLRIPCDITSRLLELSKHAKDFQTIDETCPCPTCTSQTSRAMLHHIVTHETAAAHGISFLDSRKQCN